LPTFPRILLTLLPTLRIEAIALHSHQLTKDELPQIRPEESLD